MERHDAQSESGAGIGMGKIKRQCSTCQWWTEEPIDGGMVCVNADSDYCTGWTDADRSCECWEKKEDEPET